MRKQTRPQRSVGELRCASCNSETIERRINNERIRGEIYPPILGYMAVGATGSEASNEELKHWFFGVTHLHAPIMMPQIRVPHISKIMEFRSAMYSRTAVKIRRIVLLVRVFENWGICDNWGQRRQGGMSTNRPSSVPAMEKRNRGADRLAMWKRTSNNINKKTKRLRTTPYTQMRVGV